MSETVRRDGEDGGLPTVLRTLIEQASPAERVKITNALRGRARELVKRMFGLGPYFEHTLEFSGHPLSSREQQFIGRLAGMLNDEVDWLLGSSRFDPKAMLGIPEDEPTPVDVGMALTEIRPVVRTQIKAPSDSVYQEVGELLLREHVHIYLESGRRWTFSTEPLSEALRKAVEEAGATVVPDFQYGVEQQDNKTAYWIAVKSEAREASGDWIARLRKIPGLTVEEGANPSRVRVLADATAIAIARVHVGSFCLIEEEVSRTVYRRAPILQARHQCSRKSHGTAFGAFF